MIDQNHKRDELSKVAAIWIFASNDENPIITFRSIRERVGFTNDEEVNSILGKYRELFRLGVRSSWLNELKANWLSQSDEEILPSWLKGKQKDLRERLLSEISTANVFRSQLRTGKNAPRSSVESVDWGLRHIDYLRKSESERAERKFRKYQMLIPAFSVLVALCSILLTYLSTRELQRTQWKMKYFETTLKTKQENYTQFMNSMYNAYESAIVQDGEQMLSSMKQMHSSYLMLEVYLDTTNFTEDAKVEYLYTSFCDSLYRQTIPDSISAAKYTQFRLYFRNRLFNELFNIDQPDL